MSAIKIEITYDDGLHGTFHKNPDGSWTQALTGLAETMPSVTGYDGPNVMRVLSAAVGTKEIAE